MTTRKRLLPPPDLKKVILRTGSALCLTTMALAIVISGTHTFVDDPAVFELDGNAVTDLHLGGDDWANAAGTGSGLTRAVTTSAPSNAIETVSGWPFLVNDPTGYTIFGGGSKDTLDFSQNTYTSGSVPPKDELAHGFAAAYQVTTGGGSPQPHTWIYFGTDRISTNGDSNIGVWFFQNSIAANNVNATSKTPFNGTPCPSGETDCNPGDLHRDGDIFIVSPFTQGGAISIINVYVWDHTKGGLVLFPGSLGTDNNALCNAGTTGSQAAICAIINKTNQVAPWPFSSTDSGVPPQTFNPGSFFEGGFDLTAYFQSLGKAQPCFSSFMIETRSSQSLTATIKDFVLGSFQLCAVSSSKVCTPLAATANSPASPRIVTVNGTAGIHYDFQAQIINDAAGQIWDGTITDTFPTGAQNMVLAGTTCTTSPCKVTITGAINAGTPLTVSGSFEVPGDANVVNKLSATAAAFSGGAQTVTADHNGTVVVTNASFGGTTPAVTGCNVSTNPRLTLTKSCQVDLLPTSSGVVLVLHDFIDVKNNSTDTTTSISGITLANKIEVLQVFGSDQSVGTGILSNPTSTSTVSGDGFGLVPGQTAHFEPTYTPSNCAFAVPSTLTQSGRCQLNDSVRISSIPKDEFGHDVPSSDISGSPSQANGGSGCSICPFGLCTVSGTP